MADARTDFGKRSFKLSLAAGSVVLLLLALGWWAENPGAVPGELGLEDALEDSPGLALLYVPSMVVGLVVSLKALALGLDGLRRTESSRVLALLGTLFSAATLTAGYLLWVSRFFT